MPIVAPVPFLPFRAFTDDGDPLAGGQFFAFLAGTDTPTSTFQDPAGLVLNPVPVILDAAGYKNIYLLAALRYKLRLLNALGVQQWEVDQVVIPGAGGVFTAPPLILNAITGQPVLTAVAAWQLGWRQIGVTAEVTVAFGTSGGLTQLAIGDAVQFDRWGLCGITLGADTTPAAFLTGDSPWTATPQNLLVTAIGGLFDAGGAVTLTRYYLTLE